MNKFLRDLEIELKKLNVNDKEIQEIIEDHKEMIETGKEEGLNEEELRLKFGNPSKIAKEINDDLQRTSNSFTVESVQSIVDYNLGDYTFVKSFSSMLEVTDYESKFVNDDLIISNYEGDSIQVYQKDIKDIDKYEIDLVSGTFIIKRKTNGIFGKNLLFKEKSGTFLVLIPMDTRFKDFKYHTVSGDAEMNGIVAENFYMKSTSGDVEMSNIDLGKTKFSMVSGDIELSGLKALSLDISLVNGDVEIENGKIDQKIDLNSVSGDADLKLVECDTASFKTVSGDIEGRNFYVNEISLNSISGDVEIKNDDKTRVIHVLSKKTLSGDITIN